MKTSPSFGGVRIPALQRRFSALLYALGFLLLAVGILGYLCGDLQAGAFAPLSAKVYAARKAAQSLGMPMTGTVELLGESGLLGFRAAVPIAFVSFIMSGAVLMMLLGIACLYNAFVLRRQSWESMKDLLCIEPALFFFLLFVYYPVIDLVRISFTDMRMLTGEAQPLIGLKNYEWLFLRSGSKYFLESLRITGIYTFWEVFITLAGGMLLALLFSRMTRGFNVLRSIVFMPKYIAVSTSAVVFIWILHGNHGVLNHALRLLGIQGPDWLNQADTALGGILFLTAWRSLGYAMMIYLSAMKGIPQEYYEAASIDGADGMHRFRYITIPLLAPTTLFLLVTTFIASMKVFQSVDVMTGGGPGTATNVMVQWIYNLSFTDFRTARAAAVSVVFFAILLVCTVATMRYSNRNVNYDS